MENKTLKMNFNFNVNPNEYFIHTHNSTATNERCVEIPLGIRFFNAFQDDNFVEVGAVLPYYTNFNHCCIDPVDNKATKKEYAENVNFDNLSVLSISTIEHIGRGDYRLPVNRGLAEQTLSKIVNESKRCLISWAIGYNKPLDDFVKNSKDLNYTFHRRTHYSKWDVSNDSSTFNTRYNHPFNNGNAIIWVYKNL